MWRPRSEASPTAANGVQFGRNDILKMWNNLLDAMQVHEQLKFLAIMIFLWSRVQ